MEEKKKSNNKFYPGLNKQKQNAGRQNRAEIREANVSIMQTLIKFEIKEG